MKLVWANTDDVHFEQAAATNTNAQLRVTAPPVGQEISLRMLIDNNSTLLVPVSSVGPANSEVFNGFIPLCSLEHTFTISVGISLPFKFHRFWVQFPQVDNGTNWGVCMSSISLTKPLLLGLCSIVFYFHQKHHLPKVISTLPWRLSALVAFYVDSARRFSSRQYLIYAVGISKEC